MQVKSKNKVFLPDGEYKGKWGAFMVVVPFHNEDSYQFKTEEGIKTMGVPVTIFVKNNEAIVFAD